MHCEIYISDQSDVTLSTNKQTNALSSINITSLVKHIDELTIYMYEQKLPS